MSKYLGFPNELIPMGASVLDVHNKWKTNLTEAGWQVKYEQTTVKPFELQVIPPATEAIGNAEAYEFLRISNRTVATFLSAVDQAGISCGRGPSTPSPSIYCEWIRRS